MIIPPFPLNQIPSSSGCYIYKNNFGSIIYIGKAKNLKKRVSQYFQKNSPDLKTSLLVKNIASVDFFITKNEVEALILESNLIRKYKPKFNIDLKHGKRYAHILLTDEDFPRLLSVRTNNLKGEYFGPFVDASMRHMIIKFLRKAFFIRTCKFFPNKPCLKFHLNLCKAPCVGLQSKEDYLKNVELARDFLRGKGEKTIFKLKKDLKLLSKNGEFEKAIIIRDQLSALEFLQDRSLVESAVGEEDVINYLISDNVVYVIVFSVRKGVLCDKQNFSFPFQNDFLDEFIRRFYETNPKSIPKQVVVPKIVDEVTKKFLIKLAGRNIVFSNPKSGRKKELLFLVLKNLEELLNAPLLAQKELKNNLSLPFLPKTIECFDISHTQGTNMVGSMTCFVDGLPDKSNYRRFKIKTVYGVDDFRSIFEIVKRRYSRLKKEGKRFPDLIVIDGGFIQVSFAKRALNELSLEIPVIGLAKKFEEIYFPDKNVSFSFPVESEMMKLLIRLRDETHRFGISYHRLLRKKDMIKDKV